MVIPPDIADDVLAGRPGAAQRLHAYVLASASLTAGRPISVRDLSAASGLTHGSAQRVLSRVKEDARSSGDPAATGWYTRGTPERGSTATLPPDRVHPWYTPPSSPNTVGTPVVHPSEVQPPLYPPIVYTRGTPVVQGSLDDPTPPRPAAAESAADSTTLHDATDGGDPAHAHAGSRAGGSIIDLIDHRSDLRSIDPRARERAGATLTLFTPEHSPAAKCFGEVVSHWSGPDVDPALRWRVATDEALSWFAGVEREVGGDLTEKVLRWRDWLRQQYTLRQADPTRRFVRDWRRSFRTGLDMARTQSKTTTPPRQHAAARGTDHAPTSTRRGSYDAAQRFDVPVEQYPETPDDAPIDWP